MKNVSIDSKDVFSSLWETLPKETLDKLGLFIDVSRYLIIVIIAYFVFLIVKQVFRFKDRKRLKIIANNTTEINHKLDILIKKKKKK